MIGDSRPDAAILDPRFWGGDRSKSPPIKLPALSFFWRHPVHPNSLAPFLLKRAQKPLTDRIIGPIVLLK